MSMRHVFAAAAVALMIASCAPRRPAPAPAPPPQPAPPPPAPAPPPPGPLAWEDAPLSPGDWTYRNEGGVSVAAFGAAGAASLIVRCESNRSISLTRAGVSSAASSLTVRTSFGARRVAAATAPSGVTATTSATNPVLDELAFSRGRFAIEVDGAPLLIVPAWPEPARVVEDCRG